MVVAGDFDTSFDTSDIIPHDGGHIYDSRSPLPPSEAASRLDDTVHFMLQSALDLNGKSSSVAPSRSSGSRCVSQQNNIVSHHRGDLDCSFESNPEDVVRIRVPYKKAHSTSPTSHPPLSSEILQFDVNRVRIPVNYVSPLTTPTNSPPDRLGSPTKRNSAR